MWRRRDKTKSELEKGEGALGSHELFVKRPEKAVVTQPASDAARSKPQGPSVTFTPATPQPGEFSQKPRLNSGSECTLTADSPVVMVSPYRNVKERCSSLVTFSKDQLIRMDHNKHYLEIDLLRPESGVDVFPPQDLSPLCLYRELRSLKITGMMQSYQSYIWLVVWLNPQLIDLTLEMAGEAGPLDKKAIAEAQKYAQCKPTMREVAQGKTETEVLNEFHIVNLSLTNFVLHGESFEWFSDQYLQNVQLHRCKDTDFELPSLMQRSFNLTVTA